MRSLRKWHQYIGLFFGPAIFFFALSGFLQVAGFHESHPGSTYQPAGWIVALSSLHQHQRLDVANIMTWSVMMRARMSITWTPIAIFRCSSLLQFSHHGA